MIDQQQSISSEQADRYSRQERYAPLGKEGQDRLKDSRVLIVGAGALGTGIAETLVRSGVGHITIVDRDYVEWSNLQRQQLYVEQDAIERMPKAMAAKNVYLPLIPRFMWKERYWMSG